MFAFGALNRGAFKTPLPSCGALVSRMASGHSRSALYTYPVHMDPVLYGAHVVANLHLKAQLQDDKQRKESFPFNRLAERTAIRKEYI